MTISGSIVPGLKILNMNVLIISPGTDEGMILKIISKRVLLNILI